MGNVGPFLDSTKQKVWGVPKRKDLSPSFHLCPGIRKQRNTNFGLCPESWRTWISSFVSSPPFLAQFEMEGLAVTGPLQYKRGAQSGEARGKGVPWAEGAEWPLPRLCQSPFILCFWKNRVLSTFHLDRFFYLLSLLVSLHQTSMILALLFFQTLFIFSRLQAEVQTAVILFGLFDDWWSCLQIPLLVST